MQKASNKHEIFQQADDISLTYTVYAHVNDFCLVARVGCMGCCQDPLSIMRLRDRFRCARRYVHHEEFEG